MSCEASSSQPTGGFRGSGALSHVYIQYPSLRCRVPGSRGLFYDDANKLLISPTSDQVIKIADIMYVNCICTIKIKFIA